MVGLGHRVSSFFFASFLSKESFSFMESLFFESPGGHYRDGP